MVNGRRFDLRERPWIPVRRGSERFEVGLRELLVRAHELTDIDVPLGPVAAGLWRVLYLLAARVGELDDDELSVAEFDELRLELLAEGGFDEKRVDAYFDRYADRFDLFDAQRPWLQDPRLAEQCPATSGLNQIVLGRPAKNSHVWFSHHHYGMSMPIPAAEGAWHLLAALYYGPSGRCTIRKVKSCSEGNTAAGPLRSGLSCHPIGRTVFESLVAGIPSPDGGDGLRGSARDEAPWEADELPDPLGGPVRLRGMARALTGRFQHAVLLVPDAAGEQVVDATLTWAWREKAPTDIDAYLIYQTSKKGDPYPRPASVSRALWRDLDALLLKGDRDSHLRPGVFKGVQYLPLDVVGSLRVRVFGFDQDGQTRDRQFFTQTTPPVLGWLEERRPEIAAAVGSIRHIAEQVGQNLEQALRMAWPHQDSKKGKKERDKRAGVWVEIAEGQYWPAAEKAFWRLLDQVARSTDTAPVVDGAPDAFLVLAERIYDNITNQLSSRTHDRMIRALVQNRYRIRAGF
ncbi:MAG: type I-E CRISPR-associated protein Cse1/CasA [Micromonosporaceae bacterium]|nr:type I-E CRISPR-associated protein Cse1/CasA [Micromonosporaceae bacterium]